jgi:hypothetical protein
MLRRSKSLMIMMTRSSCSLTSILGTVHVARETAQALLQCGMTVATTVTMIVTVTED